MAKAVTHLRSVHSHFFEGERCKNKWSPELETAFNQLKAMVSQETLLTYPYWSKTFDIHTDVSDFQVGVVISQ